METFSALLPFVPGIHRSPVNSPHKGQYRGALAFSLICAWVNGRVNNREVCDFRHHRAHYDVTVMNCVETASQIYPVFYHISMAWCQTAVTQLPTHCSYCSLALSHRYNGSSPHFNIHKLRSKCHLQWRHHERDGVSNHQPHDCLLKCLFRRRSKKTSKLRITGLCEGNSPVTGEFPTQRASNAENVSIWWRHHAVLLLRLWFRPVAWSTIQYDQPWEKYSIFHKISIRFCYPSVTLQWSYV